MDVRTELREHALRLEILESQQQLTMQRLARLDELYMAMQVEVQKMQASLHEKMDAVIAHLGVGK